MSSNVIIVKIPTELKDKEQHEKTDLLMKLLEQFGHIKKIDVLTRGAFVEFETGDGATTALRGCTAEMNARLYK